MNAIPAVRVLINHVGSHHEDGIRSRSRAPPRWWVLDCQTEHARERSRLNCAGMFMASVCYSHRYLCSSSLLLHPFRRLNSFLD